MPASQPGGPERVIGEEEVIDGMLLTACGARLMRIRPGAHTTLVSLLERTPARLRENVERERCQDHAADTFARISACAQAAVWRRIRGGRVLNSLRRANSRTRSLSSSSAG